MFRRLIAIPPNALRKWCAFALMMIVPGSFVALAVIWLARAFVAQVSAQAVRELAK